MSDTPTPPTIGQDPWGEDLNALLTSLQDADTATAADIAALQSTDSALIANVGGLAAESNLQQTQINDLLSRVTALETPVVVPTFMRSFVNSTADGDPVTVNPPGYPGNVPPPGSLLLLFYKGFVSASPVSVSAGWHQLQGPVTAPGMENGYWAFARVASGELGDVFSGPTAVGPTACFMIAVDGDWSEPIPGTRMFVTAQGGIGDSGVNPGAVLNVPGTVLSVFVTEHDDGGFLVPYDPPGKSLVAAGDVSTGQFVVVQEHSLNTDTASLGAISVQRASLDSVPTLAYTVTLKTVGDE